MTTGTGISYKTMLIFAACASLFLCSESVFAQARPAAAKPGASAKAPLVIKEVPKVGKACLVSSPDIDGKVKSPGRTTRNKKWAMFEVGYVTSPEWIDEVTFTFYVMTQEAKTKEYHYFQTAVAYLDVAKGDHGAAVLLNPSAVARYGEPISFGVEVMINGEKVASESVGMGGESWWTKALDKLGDRVKRHSGYLQDRSKTPFGVTYIDEYEAVR